MKITKEQLINDPPLFGRHVVILGAGASKQAFPNGDLNGIIPPTMNELCDLIKLNDILMGSGLEYNGQDFEAFYSDLYIKDTESKILREIEDRVYEYFRGMQLPRHPTLYDHLLLSLRPKDIVFTFNWDPFLFDAWGRNRYLAPLPPIVHLHGNVRIGYCVEHLVYGENGQYCPECDNSLTPSKLIYPVKVKNYNEDKFIKDQWDLLKIGLKEAFAITIFGYSAPSTDKEAVDIMDKAWGKDKRFIERTEIIDTKNKEELQKQWSPFIVRTYFDYSNDYYKSRLAAFPRRTCEQLYHATFKGLFVEELPLPRNADFDELYKWFTPIISAEKTAKSN